MFKKPQKTRYNLKNFTKKLAISYLLCLILLPIVAKSDTAPTTTQEGPGCYIFTLCSSQSSNAVCDSVGNNTGDQLVADVDEFTSFGFYSTRSTASAYSCTARTNTTGHDVGNAGAINPFTSSLSDTNKWFTATTKIKKLYFTCTGISGGVVNIDVLACIGGY